MPSCFLCGRGFPAEECEIEVEEEAPKVEPTITDEEALHISKLPPRQRLRRLLEMGAVSLLSAVWLVTRDEFVLERMQDLPKEAFLSPENATELLDRLMGVVVISYSWLSRRHPDPTGFHTHTVLKYLKKHMNHVTEGPYNLDDAGVFWDFASLPQDQPDGMPMTDAEKVDFQRGLRAINLLFGDPKTVVLQLTKVPEKWHFVNLPDSEVNLTPYRNRGWCFYETTVSSTLKSSHLLLDLGLGEKELESESADWPEVQAASSGIRRPPLTPEDMALELKQRKFAKKCDAELVAQRYTEFFHEATASARTLNLSNCRRGTGWCTAELEQLVRALPAFTACEELFLDGHCALGEVALAQLRTQLLHLPALRELWLPEHLGGTREGQALQRSWLGADKILRWF